MSDNGKETTTLHGHLSSQSAQSESQTDLLNKESNHFNGEGKDPEEPQTREEIIKLPLSRESSFVRSPEFQAKEVIGAKHGVLLRNNSMSFSTFVSEFVYNCQDVEDIDPGPMCSNDSFTIELCLKNDTKQKSNLAVFKKFQSWICANVMA